MATKDDQRQFQVYQFCETLESCVLPTDWVRKGEVKYDGKKASEYIRNGKQPYKKWQTYKVRPLSQKVFDSYNTAYKAEKILLEKSDLDSSDVEQLYNPNLILNRKRQRKPVVIPGAVSHNNISKVCSDTNDELSSDDESSSKSEIENPPPVPVASALNKNHTNTTVTSFIDENFVAEPTTEINELDNKSPVPIEQQIVVHENVALSIATTADIKELKTIILKQNALIENQNNKIDQLMAMVLELHKRGKKRGHGVEDFSQKNNDSNLTFSYPDLTLPLETVESIEKLEEALKDDVIANHFRSFLLQLGGHNLKIVIKHIVRRVYSLQLQGKVNYSGREGKCCMSGLQQTKIIIEVMQRNTGKTEAEAIDEYMYHMQHVSDRIRSAERMATRMANNI